MKVRSSSELIHHNSHIFLFLFFCHIDAKVVPVNLVSNEKQKAKNLIDKRVDELKHELDKIRDDLYREVDQYGDKLSSKILFELNYLINRNFTFFNDL